MLQYGSAQESRVTACRGSRQSLLQFTSTGCRTRGRDALRVRGTAADALGFSDVEAFGWCDILLPAWGRAGRGALTLGSEGSSANLAAASLKVQTLRAAPRAL